MIFLIAFCFFLYSALGAVAFVVAKRKRALFWSDVASPIFVVVLWITIAAFGYGHQSLSHIIEIPIALLFALVFLNLRVFIVDKFNGSYRHNSYFMLGLSLLVVLLLRTFMPFLPE